MYGNLVGFKEHPINLDDSAILIDDQSSSSSVALGVSSCMRLFIQYVCIAMSNALGQLPWAVV